MFQKCVFGYQWSPRKSNTYRTGAVTGRPFLKIPVNVGTAWTVEAAMAFPLNSVVKFAVTLPLKAVNSR
jgi:hypothetical protein